MSTSVDDSRVEELFALARDLPPLQQAALLDTEIPSSATALRSAVEELLLAFRQAPPGEFVNRLAPHSALQKCLDAAWEEECDSDYATGDVIGPYRLLEIIGEGGMGVVYMAQQSSPIVRRVALKLIRPGVTGDEFVARFEAERQALSLMDHPCITKVFDAGCVERGRPYLVMELIKGVPISTYCDQRCLTTSERLSLFAQVCRGVAHAHQKGVIHRDLKPSNILVADYDDTAVPKIIDFGVAKAIGEKLVDRTLFTHFGQIVGTLQYMSPEQAKFNQLDVDVRSDVYALGAILYELLTGTTPFELAELRRAAFDEALRMIRHDEPPKPSTRISSSEAPAVVAANRGVDDRTLKRSLSGDLDAIVMTALAKDRGRRYQSAQSFAEDIDRYHQDVAVLARRPSRFEEAQRFLRRHVLLVTLTFAGVVTMAAIGTSVITGLRAELARANQRLSERMRQVAVLAAESDFLRPRRAIDSVRFALAAVEKSGENGDTVLPSAHAALLNAVVPINGVPLAPHGELLRDVAFSGEKLIVLTDQAMRVFSLGDVGLFSVEREIFHGDKGFVPGVPGRLPRRMFVSRDGRWAVTDGEKVVRWDLWAETGNPTELFTRAIAPEHRRDLTLSADGAWVGEIDVGATATPRVWRLLPEISTKPIILDTLPCRNPDGMRMEFSPCGRWVGMCVDTSVRVWRLGDDSERFSRHAEFEQSLGFSFSSSGDLIASIRKTTPGKSNEILVWRLNSPDEPPLTYPIRLAANFQSLSFAPNEKHLYITGLNELRVCRVDLTSPSSETVSTYYAGHQNALTGCEITQDGEWMVTSGLDGDVRVWPLSGKQPSRSYSVCKVHNRLFRMTIDPSGKWMATCARDGTGRLCRLQDGTLQNSPFVLPGGSKNAGTTVSTSGDGTRVATHGRGNAVACWRIEGSGSPALTELGAGDTGVRAVEVSANGKLVLAAYDDASVRLWDFPTNEAPGVAKVLRGPTSEWSGRQLTATFIGSSSLVIGHADGSVEVLSGVVWGLKLWGRLPSQFRLTSQAATGEP